MTSHIDDPDSFCCEFCTAVVETAVKVSGTLHNGRGVSIVEVCPECDATIRERAAKLADVNPGHGRERERDHARICAVCTATDAHTAGWVGYAPSPIEPPVADLCGRCWPVVGDPHTDIWEAADR